MTETVEIPTLLPAVPEIVLAVGAMLLLMVGVFRGEQASKGIETGAILLLLVTALIVGWLPAGKLVTFGGSFVVDGFARFLKLLALAGSAAAIVMSSNYLAVEKRVTFEYSILILLSTVGMMMLISAADLIALYLGLELMSLALYVVAAIDRDSIRSTEAGLKYFVLGALSSGMLLYGASLVYGFTGTVSLVGIAKASGQGGIGLVFGLVFLFAGFCFKISAVPFHMWTPDVYEGVQGVLVYMAIYVAMTLGTFACILAMRREGQFVEDIRDLSGLARTKPALAFFLAVLLFSLAGIPPLAGFFAKFYVFLAAIKAGLFALAVIGVVTSVVGAYYYLVIVKTMYFDEPAKPFEPMPHELKAVLGATGLFNLLFFVYPSPLVEAADAAAKSLF